MSTKNNLSFPKDRIAKVNQRTRSYALAALLLLLPMLTLGVLVQPTNAQVQAPRPNDRIISYQAQILNGGEPVPDGQYFITASLYSDEEGRSLLWRSTYTTEVRGGIANLNLGEVRNGGAPLPSEGLDGPLYLGIGIGRNPGETGEEMRPLTRLTTAVNALSVSDGSITKDKLATSYIEKILINADTIDGKAATLSLRAGPGISIRNTGKNNYLIGTTGLQNDLSGSGPAWTEDGNTIATNTAAFVGTKDNYPFLLRANNQQVMQYAGSNIIGGNSVNNVTTGTVRSVIAGGGDVSEANSIQNARFSVIGGGQDNIVNEQTGGYSGQHDGSVIGGGSENRTRDNHTTIAGGFANEAKGQYTTVTGGNTNKALSSHSTIGGGEDNIIEAGYGRGTIAGGGGNRIAGARSTIGGGTTNRIEGGDNVIAGGGSSNGDRNEIAGDFNSLVGGRNNRIGQATMSGEVETATEREYSMLAGGRNNHINSDYSFLGGGDSNYTGSSYATLGGGKKNTVTSTSAQYGTISGGQANQITGVTVTHSAIGGGYTNVIDSASYSTIPGGAINEINSSYAVVGGGESNLIQSSSSYSTVAGGKLNLIDGGAPYSTIGGGYSNRVQGQYSVIAGGNSNQINHINADHNFTGGGYSNIQNNPSLGVIGGGWHNLLDTAAWASLIGGGEYNAVRSSRSFLGGGSHNEIEKFNTFSALVGGEENSVWAAHSFIGGGYRNLNHDVAGVLVGGYADTLRSSYGFLGGGRNNHIDWNSDSAVLVGGSRNYVNFGQNSFLGGGFADTLLASHSFLGGGENNKIEYLADHSVIVGGQENTVSNSANTSFIGGGLQDTLMASHGFLGGGSLNKVADAGEYSALGGGRKNLIEGPYGFIGGGDSNRIIDPNSTKSVIGGGQGNALKVSCWGVIGGGDRNMIWTESVNTEDAPNFSSILGGSRNLIDTAQYSAIGGGWLNRIGSNADYATIPGGEFLRAQSYNQIVMGRYNKEVGSSTRMAVVPNDPLVIVGNGSNTIVRSNAFEISNNGHSIVFHMNGTAEGVSGSPAIIGATYVDNTVLAWGEVKIDPMTNAPEFVSNFGAATVIRVPGTVGIYRIDLNLNDAYSTSQHVIDHASITATIVDTRIPEPNETNGVCGFITTTPIQAGANSHFYIRTYDGDGGCEYQDKRFMFKVTGRKEN